MKLKVVKNEHTFTPDICDNLKTDEKEQFKIVLKKVNTTLDANKYAEYEVVKNEAGENDIQLKSINNNEYFKAHIVKFINAPELEDEAGKKAELTKDTLFSNEYDNEVLDELLNQVIAEINKLASSDKDIKK